MQLFFFSLNLSTLIFFSLTNHPHKSIFHLFLPLFTLSSPIMLNSYHPSLLPHPLSLSVCLSRNKEYIFIIHLAVSLRVSISFSILFPLTYIFFHLFVSTSICQSLFNVLSFSIFNIFLVNIIQNLTSSNNLMSFVFPLSFLYLMSFQFSPFRVLGLFSLYHSVKF